MTIKDVRDAFIGIDFISSNNHGGNTNDRLSFALGIVVHDLTYFSDDLGGSSGSQNTVSLSALTIML